MSFSAVCWECCFLGWGAPSRPARVPKAAPRIALAVSGDVGSMGFPASDRILKDCAPDNPCMSSKLAMRLLSRRSTARKGTPAQAWGGGTLASELEDKSCKQFTQLTIQQRSRVTYCVGAARIMRARQSRPLRLDSQQPLVPLNRFRKDLGSPGLAVHGS